MRLLVLVWGCLLLPGSKALKGPEEISGFEGDTVSLQCTYGEKLKEHRKYWCRDIGILVPRCGDKIYTKEDQEVTQERVSIRDNPQELLLTVTMRALTLEDAGKYWCGVDTLDSVRVSLIVFKGSSRPATWLPPTMPKGSRAVAGSSVSEPSVSIPMARMMAPLLVLLSLLLATGLIACSSHVLQRRKKAWLATEIQRKEEVYLPALTTEEEPAPSQDSEKKVVATPPLMSSEEPSLSEFISV